MAEAVLGSLLLKFGAILAPEVGKSLWSLTTKEASQLASVQKEMRDITHELEMMLAFVKHADRASKHDEHTAVWVKQVREAAYEAEDIIDEYTYILGGRKKSGLRNCLAKPKSIHAWHGIATRLKDMKNKIKNISEIKNRYDVKGMGEGSSSTDSRDAQLYHEDPCLFFRKDSDLVGMENNKQVLFGWLMDGKEELMEISVCGMGGLGKSTLVAQLYKSEVTKQHFEYRAWITVSNTYKIDDILKRTIKELLLEKKETVPQGIDTMDRRRLAEMLHQLLEQKRNTSLEFKLLRVLDLEDAPADSIPDAVGDLFNLRYLGLRNTKVKILPKRLKRLWNLQTLDLADSNVKEIPYGVTKLPNLRHVFLQRNNEDGIWLGFVKIKPKHTWVSKELQTLQGISSNNEVVRRVENLTQLRSFGIVDVRESEGTKLCASIKKMKFLHHLQIQATDTGDVASLVQIPHKSQNFVVKIIWNERRPTPIPQIIAQPSGHYARQCI